MGRRSIHVSEWRRSAPQTAAARGKWEGFQRPAGRQTICSRRSSDRLTRTSLNGTTPVTFQGGMPVSRGDGLARGHAVAVGHHGHAGGGGGGAPADDHAHLTASVVSQK